jgi:uncharacterized damage-inducible protein DinB
MLLIGGKPMNPIEPMIAELQQEATITRRMLKRVPQDSLAWQPHEKSTKLGRLAAHIATLPLFVTKALSQDELNNRDLIAAAPASDDVSGILEAFDKNIAGAIELLKTQTGERLFESWSYKDGEKLIFKMPRLAVIRFIALNHLIHHRGQLSVYLRLLDIPLPSVYGPTADEPAPKPV